MINFSLDLKTNIHFGEGSVKEIKNELSQYKKILLVTGGGSVKKNGVFDAVMEQLKALNIEVFELSGVKPNPSIESVREGIKTCRENNIEFILAVGGGSAIDAAKGMATGVVYEGDVWDVYLDNSKFSGAIKTGCVLTLAATGSETNGNTVVTNEETTEKLAIRQNALRPEFAILDPTYTYTLPPKQTSAGVADIMAHAFEQYFSPTKTAYQVDRLAETVIKTCIKFGPIALKEPENYEARANIMWAATLGLNGILTFGKITDWATHMIEHELSAYYDLNHGYGLAILFPNWMKHLADESRMWKYREYAVNVWGLSPELSDEELSEQSIAKTREFFNSMNLPSTLREVDINDEHFEVMAANVVRRGTRGSFKVLDKEDIVTIYKMSL